MGKYNENNNNKRASGGRRRGEDDTFKGKRKGGLQHTCDDYQLRSLKIKTDSGNIIIPCQVAFYNFTGRCVAKAHL